MLPTRFEQIIASAWCRKLCEALYNADALREKRNHHLLMLTICMALNGLRHPFDKQPNEGELEELSSFAPLKNRGCTCAADEHRTCDLHSTKCPIDVDNIGEVLDEQFKFLMGLSEPYVNLLTDPADRRRARQWVSFLKSVDSNCFHMKGVRNDYAMLLSGYFQNGELPGLFQRPPIDKLVSLESLVKIVGMGNSLIIDPMHPRTLKFFRDVPHPEDGAFAFIAVSGDICSGAST